MDWMTEGTSDVDKSYAEREEQKIRQSARRFFVTKERRSADVVFLDDRFVKIKEHARYVNNRSYFFTCSGLANGCSFCHEGYKAHDTFFFSIIDRTQWKDKNNNVHENERKILALNTEQAKTLKDKAANWGGLAGRAVRITRTGDRAPASGNDFEPIMRDGRPVVIDPKKFFKDAVPFDYRKVLAPLARDQMAIEAKRLTRLESASEAVALDQASLPAGGSDWGALPGDPGPSEPFANPGAVSGWGANTPPPALDDSRSDIPF